MVTKFAARRNGRRRYFCGAASGGVSMGGFK
jgi:hypothetical protein